MSQVKGTFSSIFGEESLQPQAMAVTHQLVADQLLQEGFLLTALEFHTELLEAGRELKTLSEFFSNPSNLLGAGDDVGPPIGSSPETPGKTGGRRSAPGTPGYHMDISRSASQMTLDSIDQMTRYSEVLPLTFSHS